VEEQLAVRVAADVAPQEVGQLGEQRLFDLLEPVHRADVREQPLAQPKGVRVVEAETTHGRLS
jgi:hypothetical protein